MKPEAVKLEAAGPGALVAGAAAPGKGLVAAGSGRIFLSIPFSDDGFAAVGGRLRNGREVDGSERTSYPLLSQRSLQVRWHASK